MAEPNGLDNFMARWETVPRWALIGAVVVVGAVSYLIYRSLTSNTSSTEQTKSWAKQATSYLRSQGYSAADSDAAINAYTNGQQLTPSQVSLVAAAIGSLGLPGGMKSNSAVTAQVANTPTTGPGLLGSASGGTEGNAGGGTTLPGSPYPSNSGQIGGSTNFWNVPAGAAGWSTTFNGIGGQFGVNPTVVQDANPNLSKTLWGKIPRGSIVKVPRPATGD